MQKRFVFLALAAGVCLWGLGALEARASSVGLPTTLDQLLVAGATTSVAAPNETETFSNFTYSTSPTGSPPAAADVSVKAFQAGGEAGLTFTGAFAAAPNATIDYAISYVVTAPTGHLLTDASVSGVLNPFGGSGVGSIGETLINNATGAVITTLAAFGTGSVSDSVTFAGVSSILVEKDILLVGGSGGVGLSFVNQGYSSSGKIPEPATLSLLGIGMTGFFAFRRLFKRTSAA